MGRNLSTLFISSSYQFLTQLSGSELQTGLGTTITGSLLITSSQAISASFATTASFALNAGSTVSTASLLTTASAVANVITFTKGDGSTFPVTVATGSGGGSVNTGSLLITASISNATTTYTKGDGSTFSLITNNVVNASSASVATSASFATSASQATSASYSNVATSASYALVSTTSSFAINANSASYALNSTSASYANNATSASFATTASFALNAGTSVNTGSLLTTASISNATTTFTKGDGSTFSLITNNVVNATSASFASTASQAVSSSFATSASQAQNAVSASFYGGSVVSASFATTASFAQTIASGLSPTFANVTASNVLITGTASVALLYTQTVSSSTIYSSGSNQFGDASNDVQTLYGTFNVVNGPTNFTGSVNSVNGYTGSLQGTASFATSASQAVSSSRAVSASFATTASFALNVTPTNTGSFLVTASAASNVITFTKGDASTFNVTVSTGSAAAAFPYTGSAVITGSLVVSGSITAYPTLQTETAYNLVWGNVNLGQGGTFGGGYQHAILGGVASTIDGGRASTLIGGEGNRIKGGGTYDTIIGGGGNIIETPTGGYNAIIASYLATLQSQSLHGNYTSFAIGTDTSKAQGYASGVAATKGSTASGRQTFVAGALNSFAQGEQVAIIASSGSTISASNAAVIGGTGIAATADNTVYVPNLVVTGSTTGVVGNNSDTYTTSPKVQQVITLTQAEYNGIGSPNANTLYIISGSTPVNVGSFATTGSNTFVGNQIISGSLSVTLGITGSLLGTASFATTATTASYFNLGAVTQNAVFSGSVRGEVKALSISSNTASMDCSLDNFFTLTLVNGSGSQLQPTNILPGQTINVLISQPATTGSGQITFPTSIKQVSGSAYTPTQGASAQDIITFISYDSTNLYLSNIKNFV
jgi:hypothetical protein